MKRRWQGDTFNPCSTVYGSESGMRYIWCCCLVLCMVWFTCGATLAASTDDDAVGTGTEVTGLSSIGLSAVLQAVMANHPAVKGKQAELDAQHFAIGSAKAGRYPSLSGEANNLDDNVDQFTLRVQQPLWAFGKIDRAIQQEQARFAAEEWGLLQVQRQLTEESASAYARLDGIRQRGQVSRININEHEELYQRTERRQKGQLTSEADLRFAHSRLIQAQAKHERISGELQVALVDLLALTQVPIASDHPIDPALAELPGMKDVEVLALEKSADVGYKRYLVDVARLGLQKEKVASLPDVYLRVEHEVLDAYAHVDETRVGLVIEGNLEGLGLVTRGRIGGAASALAAAGHDLGVVVNDVQRRVSTLMINRNVLQALAESQRAAVEAEEATLASFLRQYETGRKSLVDMLNSQRELTELRLQLVQIENDWLIVSMRLAALTGGLDRLAGIESL